jgi:hypothetical protein
VHITCQAANYKLWSPQDMNTRPMMAAVRGAVFSMLTAFMHGDGQTASTFPPVRLHARLRSDALALTRWVPCSGAAVA